MKKTHNHFTALFLGPPEDRSARRQLLDFMVQGKITRGRHTDHPAGSHSIRTKQCPPPPSHFLQAGCPSCHPTNSVKALKATSAFRLGRRLWVLNGVTCTVSIPHEKCVQKYPFSILASSNIAAACSHMTCMYLMVTLTSTMYKLNYYTITICY